MGKIIRERQIEDLTGRKFGRLTVIERAEDYWMPCGRHVISWLCQCDCGSSPVIIRGKYLKDGRTQSCGCLQRERTSKSNLSKKRKRNAYDDMGDYLVGHFFNCEDCFIVDKDDYEKVKDYCWYKNTGGYVTTTSDGTTIKIHQVIMNGKNIDHINGDKLDNRKINLRFCTTAENVRNVGIRSNNTSGVTGVSYSKREGKWKSNITYSGVVIRLGTFTNKEDAIKARKEAEEKYFGEFAYKG